MRRDKTLRVVVRWIRPWISDILLPQAKLLAILCAYVFFLRIVGAPPWIYVVSIALLSFVAIFLFIAIVFIAIKAFSERRA